MKVLVLGPSPSPVSPILREHGDSPLEWEIPLTAATVASLDVGFAVSYRYQHILPPSVLDALAGNVINLHISLLPWNRGSDPNLWSFLDDTPKGVTIHYMTQEIDAGDVVAQQEMFFPDPKETLASTYDKLNIAILELFRSAWPAIRSGRCARRKQPHGGTSHKIGERQRIQHLLEELGWNTPVANLKGRG